MKVLHLYAGNLYGGIERVLITLAQVAHLRPGLEHRFGLCFEGRLSEELRAAGAAVEIVGGVRFARPWTLLRARRNLATHLARERPDAVAAHASWPYAAFAPVVRRAGVRLAYWAHDTLAGGHWIDRLAARTRPDAILANSRYTAGTVPAVFPAPAPTVLVAPMAPSEPAPYDSAESKALRAELGTPPGDVVILQASRLEEWKGARQHALALARLAGVPGWTAWFAGGAQKAGEAEFLAELKAIAEAGGVGGRVKFLGQRRDVPKLLAACDIFCQPNSGPEPFGVVFVEALSAGRPVVATTLGGALEIVTPECGVLVPPSDPAALAGVLRELITDPARRRKLGAAGPARASELCDPARQLAALEMALSPVPNGVA